MSGPVALHVLEGIDLDIEKGEMLAIVGASGVGKSTLLHILGALDRPTSGKVFYGDVDVFSMDNGRLARFRNERVGFVFQFHHLLPEFTALENTCMPLLIRGLSPKHAEKKARSLLEKVGLGHRLQHKPGELSGGERQRTAVARALVTEPKCVLADEPTGNLDYKTADQVYELMLELNQAMGTSFVVVTHDPRLAQRLDRTLHLEQGLLKL